MYDIAAIEFYINGLAENPETPNHVIFDLVAEKYDVELIAEKAAKLMGCRCPYGLVGWLEAENEVDNELEELFAETEKLFNN